MSKHQKHPNHDDATEAKILAESGLVVSAGHDGVTLSGPTDCTTTFPRNPGPIALLGEIFFTIRKNYDLSHIKIPQQAARLVFEDLMSKWGAKIQEFQDVYGEVFPKGFELGRARCRETGSVKNLVVFTQDPKDEWHYDAGGTPQHRVGDKIFQCDHIE